MFESVEDNFEVSTVWAVRGEVFDKFEAATIICD